jgi:FG-GAP-like repeat
VSHLISISRSLFCLVLALALGPPGLAQQGQSYRSYRRLSGRVLGSGGKPEKKSPESRTPTPFQGWKHPGKSGAAYLKHFSRPAAGQMRAELLANAARSAGFHNGSTPQTQPPLAGLLFRESLPAGYIPTAVAAGDFNGDGKVDFVVANGGDNNLWLYFGNGDGTFSLPIILPITLGQSPVWIAAADLRGTGKTDLIVAEADSNSIGVFLGKGDGTFKESSIPLAGSVLHPRHHQTAGRRHVRGRETYVVAAAARALPLLPVRRAHRASRRLRRSRSRVLRRAAGLDRARAARAMG